jgi:heme exporter protein C
MTARCDLKASDPLPADSESSMVLCLAACVLMAVMLYLIFWRAPLEAPAALTQRLIYVYVPSVWMSGAACVLLMLTSVGYLFTAQSAWQSRAAAMAEVGGVFCGVTEIAGLLRGKALTGRWWHLNRVTALILVLWGLLLAYLALRRYAVTPAGRKWLAGFGVVACFSVPGAYSALARVFPMPGAEMIAREYASSGGETMLVLVVSILAFFLLFWYLVQQRVALDVMADELEQLRQTMLRPALPTQPWQKQPLLVENQNFVIEGYSFTEHERYE